MIESVHRFVAMGSDCAITIASTDTAQARVLADQGEATVRQLEALWSRFRPDSELMMLNDAAGSAFGVSPDTFAAVGYALEAWRLTDGLFDPTLLDALIAAGYDRSFDTLPSESRNERGLADSEVSGPAVIDSRHVSGYEVPAPPEVQFDDETFSITLPAGLRLDLGGIGKGRAADIVATLLERGGAAGGCVDLGGDIVVFGDRTEGQSWAVAVDDPDAPGTDLAVIVLDEGAVATSSQGRRRWRTAAGDAHHLIDPRTGASARSDLVAVTVVAAEAMWAEVYAKAALIAGSVAGTAMLESAGLAAMLVTDEAQLVFVGAIDEFMIPTGTSH